MGVPGGGIAGALDLQKVFVRLDHGGKSKPARFTEPVKHAAPGARCLDLCQVPTNSDGLEVANLRPAPPRWGGLNHTRARLQRRERGTLGHSLFADNRSCS